MGMSDASTRVLHGLEQVEELLAEPRPLCLALLAIEPRVATAGAHLQPVDATALIEAVAVRLRETLRPYDELQRLADGRFVITLPTLAGAEVLGRRMARLFHIVAEPYQLAGGEVPVRALLGAAVRTPQDQPAGFLARVLTAVDTARAGDGRAPVLV